MALPLILAGVQAGIGAAQAISGYKKKKNLTRPEYQIPEEIERNMTEAELMSYYGLPDAQKEQYMQNIQRSTQGALRGISDRKGGLGAVSVAQQTQQDAYMNLLSADVQQRMQNIQTAQDMRQTMANYRDKAFAINEMQPYEQDYAEAQSLIGAGMQNVVGGLTQAVNYQTAKEVGALGAATGGGGNFMTGLGQVGNFFSNQYQGFQNRRAIANTDLGQMQPLNLGFQTPNPFMSPASAPDNYVMNY